MRFFWGGGGRKKEIALNIKTLINDELESIWKEAVVAVSCTIWTFVCENKGMQELFVSYFNPLKTKRRLLSLKTQFVPRSKHFSSLL